ncbi:hypothetical protein R3P38DRAFT_2762203 [Favolaschia claudopus]|uniref:Uncharacterized protein n=1 Tax=Favolaschia claudopus TaxID=2862362 RepID=A0AAW0DK61_9AGAR
MTVRKNIVGTKYVPNGPQTMAQIEAFEWGWKGGLSLAQPNRVEGTQVLGRVEYIRSFVFRHKCTASIEYVSLIGLQNHALRVSGVLARFRDINLNRYRHCVDPNTPIEAIRNPARQDQSRDVKVGDNPRAQTLSFGKEIEEHTIQQGSVRVNNGKQQDIGELAAHSCPLERKGNQGHRSEGRDVLKQ